MMTDVWKIAAAKPRGVLNYLNGKIWVPVNGFQSHLIEELHLTGVKDNAITVIENGVEHTGSTGFTRHTEPVPRSERLVYCEGIRDEVFWKQVCWEAPFVAGFGSIGEAAEILRGIQRNWAHYPVSCFRRAELIGTKLPYIGKKEKPFPYTVPLAGMGIWSLLDEHTLLASAKTSSPFPLGSIRFAENHQDPPSRAYLKLWEALSLLDFYYRRDAETGSLSAAAVSAGYPLPKRGSRCIDAGACPGGWTWVLDSLGAEVIAIDRSPLADSLRGRPHITFIRHDAFTLSPEELGKQDWIFSDVICYPPRLLEWVERWLASGLCDQFVCTIKMQGTPDFDTIRRFAHIPHSKIVHLVANKHELTWLHAPFIRAEGLIPRRLRRNEGY